MGVTEWKRKRETVVIDPEMVTLSSTDTTIGFLSQSRTALDRVKGRINSKPYITALPSLYSLRQRVRASKRHHRFLRRARRTSFVFPNGESYRIVRDSRHLLLLRRLGWAYTTSANPAGKPYDEEFARDKADLVVEPLEIRHPPSRILHLSKRHIRRLR